MAHSTEGIDGERMSVVSIVTCACRGVWTVLLTDSDRMCSHQAGDDTVCRFGGWPARCCRELRL